MGSAGAHLFRTLREIPNSGQPGRGCRSCFSKSSYHWKPSPAGYLRFRYSDLLRFFRLQQYGHRDRPLVRLSVADELQLALPFCEPGGFLAPLAYFAFELAARLRLLFPARTALEVASVHLQKPLRHDAGLRSVAWSRLAVRALGLVSWRALVGLSRDYFATQNRVEETQRHSCARLRTA